MSVGEAGRRRNDRLDSLRREAASCRACPLWKKATQTVFGEGPPDAEIMLVGEQPGDRGQNKSCSKSYVKVERSMTIRRPVGLMLAVEEI